MRKIQYSQYNSKEIKEWIESSDENKQLADKAYKDYVEKNIRNFRLRVKLGDKELTSSDISSIRINSDLFSSDSFTIGSVIAETLELTLFTDTVFKTDDIDYLENNVISKKKPIVPYIALRTEVEINGVMEEVWQEVCMGAFYINPDGINEDGLGIMSIRASSLFIHPEYSGKTLEAASSNSTIKRNLYKIIENVRVIDNHNNPNFTLKNTDLPDIEISDESGNVIGKSVREVINYISILYGGYARTTYENGTVYLEFVRLTQTNYAYDESSYVNLTRGGAGSGLNITQIKCRTGNKLNPTIRSGSGNATTNTVHIECPDMTQEQLNLILTKYERHIFRPTTTKIFGNPLLEVGDITTIYGRGINSSGAKLPLHSVVYNITGSGVTMDIKALYKVSDVAKYVAEKDKEDKENQNNPEDPGDGNVDVSEQIKDLYDRTTIQYKDDDKGLPLITLKEDYLNTKEDLNNHKTTASNNFTNIDQRCTAIENSIKNLGGGSNPNPTGSTFVGDVKFKRQGSSTDYNGLLSPSNYIIGSNTVESFDVLGYKALVLGTNSGTPAPFLYLYVKNGIRKIELDTTAQLLMSGNEIIMDGGSIMGDIGNSSYWTASKASLSYCKLNTYFDANYNEIRRASFKDCDPTGLTSDLSAQSEYSASLINSDTDENKTHINMSYDSNEVRWCWKETVFTYKEADIDPETDEWVYTGRHICYIELPIFLAENIQNDYHINVSKMSWGDYRIIEKNPYYFILESQEEDFAFTFEVVAKLNDNQTLDNNAIIANIGYED